ncbi:MAG: hypothetical protein ACRDJG_00280 [Actinomycetota bacterium]
MSFIPFLAPICGPIALIAGALAFLTDAALAATGNGDWKMLLVDAALMALPGAGRLLGVAMKGTRAGAVAGRTGRLLRSAPEAGGGGSRLPMNRETVQRVAKQGSVDLKGVKVRINKSIKGLYGKTDPDQTTTLYRDAFKNEEQLAKTIAHERHHVEQIRRHGRYPENKTQWKQWENEAEAIEESYWETYQRNRP